MSKNSNPLASGYLYGGSAYGNTYGNTSGSVPEGIGQHQGAIQGVITSSLPNDSFFSNQTTRTQVPPVTNVYGGVLATLRHLAKENGATCKFCEDELHECSVLFEKGDDKIEMEFGDAVEIAFNEPEKLAQVVGTMCGLLAGKAMQTKEDSLEDSLREQLEQLKAYMQVEAMKSKSLATCPPPLTPYGKSLSELIGQSQSDPTFPDKIMKLLGMK